MIQESVYDQKENSGRNRIAIIWPEPEPDRPPTDMAGFDRIQGFLSRFYISSSVVLSNTIIGNFHGTLL